MVLQNGFKPKRTGRPKKLTARDKARLGRAASNSTKSARRLKDELELNVSLRTVQYALSKNPNLHYVKMKCKPPLTPVHRARRLDFCNARIEWDEEWKRILFSDEKKFNLDGPDGLAYYWHDRRKGKRLFPTRQFGGGSVMVWGAMGWNGLSQLVFLEGNQNAANPRTLHAPNPRAYG